MYTNDTQQPYGRPPARTPPTWVVVIITAAIAMHLIWYIINAF